MTTYIKGTFPVRFRRDGKDGESAYLNTITLRGTSKSDTANPVGTATIRVNGETTSYVTSMSDGYGINMWVINRNTLEVTGNVGYTSTSPVNGSVFHAILSGINDNALIAIVSWGQFCMPDDIALKLNDFGGDFNGKMSFGRRAFAFIGYRGLARGRALQVVNEGDGLTAEISTTVIDGMIQLGSKDGENGKDGKTYYTWVKYADALDNQGYPSEMYDSPKPTTQYIGISYNNESATEGTSPTSYTWTKIKGENGVDGTSFKVRGTCEEVYTYDAFNEDVEKVVGKIYLLEDPDAEDFNAMAVKWTSSGQEDLKAVDGDAFVKESNKVLFVKDRNVWRDLGTIQGPKGDKGNDGQDAVNYRLESSIKAIHLNNDGSPQITEFTLNAYMFKGSMSMPFDDTYNIVALISHSGSKYPVTKSGKLSSNVSYFTVELTDDKGNIINNIKSITCSLYRGGIKYDSFAILPIKAGAAGVSYFPNMRGNWSRKETYKWDGVSRDMVTYTEGGVTKLYAVKTPGTTIEAGTDITSNLWQVSDANYQIVFGNFAYLDNASVGGFVFSEEQMRSTSTTDENSPKSDGSNCNILLNGNTGKFVANHATIRGEVNATSGTFKNVKITNNCWIEPETKDGDGWFMRGGNDRIAAWWLGYSGKLTGQFTMNTVYNDGSNHPPTASLTFMTPNIQQGVKPDGLIRAYSNINTPLANFSHANGVMVRICPSEGVGMTFIDNVGNANPIAFNGKGHGALNGVIQGYKLNVMSSGQIDISNGNTVYCNGNGTNLILPTRENCSNVLGTTGAFALDLTIIGASGARDFRVYGKRHNSTTGYTTDCYLLNNDHGDNWYATMSQGDVLTLKLIYTGTSFYAYIVNMQN